MNRRKRTRKGLLITFGATVLTLVALPNDAHPQCVNELADWVTSPNIPGTSGLAARQFGGRLITVVVSEAGALAYSSVLADGSWSGWLEAPPPPDAVLAGDTPPVLAELGTRMRVFARTLDDRLFSIRLDGLSWGSWREIETRRPVTGTFGVVRTRSGLGQGKTHIVYRTIDQRVRYERFDSDLEREGEHTWPERLDATIAADGENQVWVSLRSANEVTVTLARRANDWSFKRQGQYRPIGPRARVASLSQGVVLGGYFHAGFVERVQTNDVTDQYTIRLKEWRFERAGGSDRSFSTIADFGRGRALEASVQLAGYRGKLIALYTTREGRPWTVRQDMADPERPWVERAALGCQRLTSPPVLVSIDYRAPLILQPFTDAFYNGANAGNDLFAITRRGPQGRISGLNLSRTLAKSSVRHELGLFDNPTNLTAAEAREMPLSRVRVRREDRPYLTEVGMALWSLPHWLGSGLFRGAARTLCFEGQWTEENTGGRITEPCANARLPMVVQGLGQRVFLAQGVWQTVGDDDLRIWEELGHFVTYPMGIGNLQTPSLADEERVGIPLAVLSAAAEIFRERAIDDCAPANLDTSNRCRGFTGHGNNYDTGGREHSFLYSIYYYVGRGRALRAAIRSDLCAGDDLLLRKYAWIRDHVYRGVEFNDDAEPRAQPGNISLSCGVGASALNGSAPDAQIQPTRANLRPRSDS